MSDRILATPDEPPISPSSPGAAFKPKRTMWTDYLTRAQVLGGPDAKEFRDHLPYVQMYSNVMRVPLAVADEQLQVLSKDDPTIWEKMGSASEASVVSRELDELGFKDMMFFRWLAEKGIPPVAAPHMETVYKEKLKTVGDNPDEALRIGQDIIKVRQLMQEQTDREKKMAQLDARLEELGGSRDPDATIDPFYDIASIGTGLLLQMGESAAGGAATGIVGALAGAPAAGIGAVPAGIAGFGFGFTATMLTKAGMRAAGATWLRQRQKGVDPEKAFVIALVSGAAQAAVNKIGSVQLGGAVIPGAEKVLQGGLAKIAAKVAEIATTRVGQAVGGAVVGAVGETYEELVQNAIDYYADNLAAELMQDKSIRPDQKKYVENQFRTLILTPLVSMGMAGPKIAGAVRSQMASENAYRIGQQKIAAVNAESAEGVVMRDKTVADTVDWLKENNAGPEPTIALLSQVKSDYDTQLQGIYKKLTNGETLTQAEGITWKSTLELSERIQAHIDEQVGMLPPLEQGFDQKGADLTDEQWTAEVAAIVMERTGETMDEIDPAWSVAIDELKEVSILQGRASPEEAAEHFLGRSGVEPAPMPTFSDNDISEVRNLMTEGVVTDAESLREWMEGTVNSLPGETKSIDYYADLWDSTVKRAELNSWKGYTEDEVARTFEVDAGLPAEDAKQAASYLGVIADRKGGMEQWTRKHVAPGKLYGELESDSVRGTADDVSNLSPPKSGPDIDDQVARPVTLYSVHNMEEWKSSVGEWMRKQGRSEEEIGRHQQAIEGQMKIMDALGVRDYEFFPVTSETPTPGGPLRKNSSTFLYRLSFDLSSTCVKRLGVAATASYLQEKMGKTLTKSQMMALISMYKMEGKAAPCLFCYVESVRGNAQDLVRNAQTAILTGKRPEGTQWKGKTLELMKAAVAEAKKLGLKEIDPNMYTDWKYTTSEEGQAVEKSAPAVYAFVKALSLSAKANTPKAYEEVGDQIRNQDPEKIAEDNEKLGLRFFSSSDFQAEHVVDVMQAFSDMELVGWKSHGFTKVVEYVEIFGDTGQKINTSIFAQEDENGNIIEDNWQGMKWADAQRLREKYKNVGAVLVASSDKIVRWGLEQDWIDYIIPWHRSGMQKKFSDVMDWEDMTRGAWEKDIETGGRPPEEKLMPVNQVHTPGGDTNANLTKKYLAWCKKQGITPVHPEFVYNEDGSVNPNYIKLKKLFARTDTPFETVKANFDQDKAAEVVQQVLKGDIPKATVDKKIAKKFMKKVAQYEAEGRPDDIGPDALLAARKGKTLFSSSDGVARAAVTFTQAKEDWQFVIQGFKGKTTLKDVIHETNHIFRRDMDPTNLSDLETHYGIEDGIWTRKTEEQFTEDVEKWMTTGTAPNDKLKTIFQYFKDWIGKIYGIIRGTDKVHPELARILEREFSPRPPEDAPMIEAIAQEKKILSQVTPPRDTQKAGGTVKLKDLFGDWRTEQPTETDPALQTSRARTTRMDEETQSVDSEELMPADEQEAQGKIEDLQALVQELRLQGRTKEANLKQKALEEQKKLRVEVQTAKQATRLTQDYYKKKQQMAVRDVRERQAEKEYVKKLIRDITRPANRLAIHNDEAKAIEALQDRFKMKEGDQTGKARAAWLKYYEQHPEEPIPEETKELMETNLAPEMSVADLEKLATRINDLRRRGNDRLEVDLYTKWADHQASRDKIIDELTGGEGYTPIEEKGSKQSQKLMKGGPVKNLKAASLSPLRQARRLGPEGTKLLIDDVGKLYAEEQAKMRERLGARWDKWEELGLRPRDIAQTMRTSGGREYTVDQVLGMYLSLKNPQQYDAATAMGGTGENLNPDDMMELVGKLPAKLKAWADAMQSDFGDENYERIRVANVKGGNTDTGPKEKGYFPMRRQDATSGPLMEQMAEDLTARKGKRKAYAPRGFTKERKNIPPERQTPIDLRATKVYTGSVAAQEHLIHYGDWARKAHAVFGDRQVREMIVKKYGQPTLQAIQNYINEVADPNAFKIHELGDGFMKKLMGNYAKGVFAFNAMPVLKNVPGVLMSMGDSGPGHLIGAIYEMNAHPIETVRWAIEHFPDIGKTAAEDAFGQMVSASPADAVNFMKKVGKAGQFGMRVVDVATKAVQAKAVYNSEISKGATQEDALAAANRSLLRTQPAGEKDLPPLLKNKSFALFTRFTRQLNQMFNMVVEDMPRDIGEALKGEGMSKLARPLFDMIAMSMTGLIIGAISRKRLPKNPKEAVVDVMSQYIAGVPLIGNDAVSLIQGKWWTGKGVSLFPATQNIAKSVQRLGKKGVDWDTMVDAFLDVVPELIKLAGGPGVLVQNVRDWARSGDPWEMLGGRPEK